MLGFRGSHHRIRLAHSSGSSENDRVNRRGCGPCRLRVRMRPFPLSGLDRATAQLNDAKNLNIIYILFFCFRLNISCFSSTVFSINNELADGCAHSPSAEFGISLSLGRKERSTDKRILNTDVSGWHFYVKCRSYIFCFVCFVWRSLRSTTLFNYMGNVTICWLPLCQSVFAFE